MKCIIIIVTLRLQLDNADEQAAQVRRELDGRLQMVEMMARVSIRYFIFVRRIRTENSLPTVVVKDRAF